MKAINKFLIIVTVVALLLPLISSVSLADTGSATATTDERTPYNAEIMDVKGGANAIATMTFDDGLMPTAQLLNKLCKEYDLKASLMLITDYFDDPSRPSIEDWNAIFAEGYLAPESHSSAHDYIVPENNSNYVEGNNTPENINEEIVGSLNALNAAFPTTPVLTYAVPYSNYTDDAFKVLMKNYYAARLGSCVLSTSSYNGKMQNLDPAHSSSLGGWYNPYMVRMQCNVDAYKSTNSATAIVNYLQRCVNYGGWFISICHGITPNDGNETTEEQLRTIMSAMKNYKDQGRLWVTSYSEATMYVRERQNSDVEAYATKDGLFVDLTMNEKTKEGLALSADVFNMPLTVRLEVPASWRKIIYTQGNADPVQATTFKEGGVNFVYLDLVPNGGTASIINVGDPTKYVEGLGIKQNVSADKSLSYNVYVPTDSEVLEVYVGRNKVEGVPLNNGTTKYSVGDIDITEITRDYNITFKFTASSGYTDYEFKRSVYAYFDDLTSNEETDERDMQLAYDFLIYARESIRRFEPSGAYLMVQKINTLIERFEGYTQSGEDFDLADMGTLANVFTGAAFAINEKPYYLFYVTPGFTGTVTVTQGVETTEYEVINGYYHCRDYVIFEVEYVYDLIFDVTITAEGTVGEETVTASGAYSIGNYIDGLTVDGVAPEYESSLYAYVISAANYQGRE